MHSGGAPYSTHLRSTVSGSVHLSLNRAEAIYSVKLGREGTCGNCLRRNGYRHMASTSGPRGLALPEIGAERGLRRAAETVLSTVDLRSATSYMIGRRAARRPRPAACSCFSSRPSLPPRAWWPLPTACLHGRDRGQVCTALRVGRLWGRRSSSVLQAPSMLQAPLLANIGCKGKLSYAA